MFYRLLSRLLVVLAIICLVLPVSKAQALQLSSRRINISTSRVSQTDVTYSVTFTVQTTGLVQGVVLDFCDNSAFIGDSCSPPAGFDTNEANLVLASQSGISGFSINAATDSNTVVISSAIGSVLASGTTVSFNLGTTGANNGLTNPSSAGTFYGRMLTYGSDTDAATYSPTVPGAYTDTGSVALAILSGGISTVGFVPPFLIFCVGITVSGNCSSSSGNQIALGELSASTTKFGTSQFAGATNDPGGYSVTTSGITMTSGTNTIPALDPAAASNTGVSQFGINLRANSSPAVGQDRTGIGTTTAAAGYNTPNLFRYVPGGVIASSSSSTDYNVFTVSYIVNVSSSQPPGVYSTTITYIATAAF